MKYFIVFFLLSSALIANDKEVISSLHGGLVKKTDTAVIEFVKPEEIVGGNSKLYIRGYNQKNLIDQKLLIEAIAKIQGEEYPLKLTYANDHYALTPLQKLKEAKNFIISFTITFPFPKKTEKTTFQIGN
jgi:hypothetical protein